MYQLDSRCQPVAIPVDGPPPEGGFHRLLGLLTTVPPGLSFQFDAVIVGTGIEGDTSYLFRRNYLAHLIRHVWDDVGCLR